MGFGAMDVTKSCKFIGFGAMDVTKPSRFIGFGAMDVTKPCKSIGFEATDVTNTYRFVWVCDINGPRPYEFIGFRWASCTQTPASHSVKGKSSRSLPKHVGRPSIVPNRIRPGRLTCRDFGRDFLPPGTGPGAVAGVSAPGPGFPGLGGVNFPLGDVATTHVAAI